MSDEGAKLHFSRRQLLIVALVVVGLYVIVPQLGSFKSSWHYLSHPDMSWLIVAILSTVLTYLAAATTYCLLALKRIRYFEVLLVELAATFINRLLPGGIGALGANFVYLRRKDHSLAQAGSIVALNNLLGIAGHAIILALVLILDRSKDRLPTSTAHDARWLILAAAVLAAVIVIGLIFGRTRFKRALADIRQQLALYRQRPLRLPLALASSMTLSLSNFICLGACALALNLHLAFVAIVLIFSAGLSAGTATPTPGGLGGFEAGLVAGFVAYHVSSSEALAAAILFRLISYWLTLVIGAVAFIICQRLKLLG